jgi:hypothetical protein
MDILATGGGRRAANCRWYFALFAPPAALVFGVPRTPLPRTPLARERRHIVVAPTTCYLSLGGRFGVGLPLAQIVF